jgi:hypothetical protein
MMCRDERRTATKKKPEQLAESVTPIDLKASKGVKRATAFSVLEHFDLFDNCYVNVMHDLLEGIVPHFIIHFAEEMINKKILTSERFAALIRDYNYGFLERKYRPHQLTIGPHGLGLNAMQTLHLIKNLPFIFIEFRAKTLKVWTALESLLQILQITFSSNIIDRDINNLEQRINSFLQFFIKKKFH